MILFTIWGCPTAKQSYSDQDLNNGIFLRKISKFLHFEVVISSPFFKKEDDLVFCYDVDCLMNGLGIKHDPQEWRLFIDSSKLSLKAMLLHNGNQHPSTPVGHNVHIKQTYKNQKQLLNKLEYSKYSWDIYSNLKVVLC
jgi:hypothetical protein